MIEEQITSQSLIYLSSEERIKTFKEISPNKQGFIIIKLPKKQRRNIR